MKIIKPQAILESDVDGKKILQSIERYGRVCYKSEDRITEDSSDKFIANIIQRGHESVLEHASITMRVICDRGVSHEIVRHRIASYSQESTRYCNYSNAKFGNELTFIEPCFFSKPDDAAKRKAWEDTLAEIEKQYFRLLELGATPQESRSILPNSLKTEIVMTMNLREWRHFIRLRTDLGAHPQMREVALEIYRILRELVPVVFSDIVIPEQIGNQENG